MDRRQLIASAALLGLAPGQAAAAAASRITEERLHGRRAFVIQNGSMRLGVLPGGGFISEASLVSPDARTNVNPMRIPHYPTIDPFTYDAARHAALYGDGMQRRLNSGYTGQFTCFPHFGSGSPAEFAQDNGQHGELLTVEWKRVGAGPDELVMHASLPMTQFEFQRSIVLPAGETVAYVTEEAENLARYDRPVQWVEHPTFGPPFVQVGKTFADGSVERVIVGTGAAARVVDWPAARVDERAVDFRVFSGDRSIWLMQPDGKGYFTLYNTDYRLLIGYLFDAAENRWLTDYQENMRTTQLPSDGKVVARGLCFGDSATSGLRNAVTQGSAYGAPTYSWFDARGRRSKRYAIFLAQIPEGFRGVETVEAAPGSITIVERETGNRIRLASSRMW